MDIPSSHGNRQTGECQRKLLTKISDRIALPLIAAAVCSEGSLYKDVTDWHVLDGCICMEQKSSTDVGNEILVSTENQSESQFKSVQPRNL